MTLAAEVEFRSAISLKMGRPRRSEQRKMININETTLVTWNKMRKEASTSGKLLTHDEFALYLLNFAANRLHYGNTTTGQSSTQGATVQSEHCYTKESTHSNPTISRYVCDLFPFLHY